MGDQAVIVVDTNGLVTLATPRVDQRDHAPSGADPLKAVLTTYDVHVVGALPAVELKSSESLANRLMTELAIGERHL